MKQIFAVFIMLILTGCGEDLEGYAISGTAEGVENGKMIYVSQLDQVNQPTIIDSVAVQDEKFQIDFEDVDQPHLSFLTINGHVGNVMYIAENETIDIEVYKDSLMASKVKGGKENETFQKYVSQIKDLSKNAMALRGQMREEMGNSNDMSRISVYQQKEDSLREKDLQFKKDLIRENPGSFVSALVLTDMQSMRVPNEVVREHFNMLTDEVKQTSFAVAVKENIDRTGAVDIGSKAPEFSGPNPDGEEISLGESLGKLTLIDFWAAWCRPCRLENPNIVNVYNKYHDKGFNIIGVSLDREDQRDRWLQAIQEDNLTWTQISHLKFWQEPIAQLYNVRAIPAAFLLDENGIIVAKNLRGEDLENKVKELLGE
ncbi:AhpC/TSA family protein [Antarcticibacterium sp. 1MA-6-2]|uniref:TlpA disulfide reductase family protein n=1 Tax=Antarcticibacterium sp. 1MA-6-2 TaxID=2908210 RepID=UPI001F161430|nr:TlpA disulfide reductase family protein [Antarcticibacterium sp. 1MA-6-2]UJH91273.1 AhpC/TSA family protein [Antarcticibacterium sp. 1MA-6-2]